MILPKKCLGCPPFLGYICWPRVVGALFLLLAPLPYYLFGVPTFCDMLYIAGEGGTEVEVDLKVQGVFLCYASVSLSCRMDSVMNTAGYEYRWL